MSSNQTSTANFLLLRPDEVNFLELFRLLWNVEIDKIKCVNYPKGKEESLRRRWLIFFSLVVQKILLSVCKPMSWFGSVFEMLLNLVTCNRNIFLLFVNFVRGTMVMPEKESRDFLSSTGNLDKRVDLDKSIKSDCRIHYTIALSVMAAKLSYENKAFIQDTVENHWKMELLDYFNSWNDFQEQNKTQSFIIHDKSTDPDVMVVAFKGTGPFDAEGWCTDLDISWYELAGMGKIHGGFMKALGLTLHNGWPREIDDRVGTQRQTAYYSIREKMRQVLGQNDRARFIVTGHSLGGALAILFPAILALHGEESLLERLEGVYTFGQPRVGDEEFKEFMTNNLHKYNITYLRFVYCNDLVPRLPTDDSTFFFKHFGTCLYFDSFYNGKVLLEEPAKNYLTGTIGTPRSLIALWELIRSFVLHHRFGLDYHENWFLKMVRCFGLVAPGLVNHNPHDYVNATRLGLGNLIHRMKEDRYKSESVLGSPG